MSRLESHTKEHGTRSMITDYESNNLRGNLFPLDKASPAHHIGIHVGLLDHSLSFGVRPERTPRGLGLHLELPHRDKQLP